MNKKIDIAFVCEWVSNVIMAVFYALFVRKFMTDYFETGRIGSLLLSVVEGILVVIYIFRKIPRNLSLSFYDWFVALLGTCLFFLISPRGSTEESLVGRAVLITGLCLQIIALVSLNRSFGVVAANRGIKKGGLYRIVRHPVYASYFVTSAGVLISYPSFYNAGVIAMQVILQTLRLLTEERFLQQDPEYREYMKSTRWRLIPYLF